jgi:hypothetical protein
MLTMAVTLQSGLGTSALLAGLCLAPMAGTFLFASLAARSLVARFGRAAIAAGALVMAAGLLILGSVSIVDYRHLVGGFLVVGMAMVGGGGALVMVPLFGLVLEAVPPAVAGTASGVLTTTQQTGLALGVGIFGTLFFTLAAGSGWAVATGVTLLAEAVVSAAGAIAALRLKTGNG